jgi:serine/threonine protein kinase
LAIAEKTLPINKRTGLNVIDSLNFLRSAMSTRAASDPEIKSGWALKQGGVFKTWKNRWFSLRGSVLRYCDKPNGKEKGRINLSEIQLVSKASECPRQPAFKILVPGRVYFIVTETPSQILEWIEAIEKVRNPADIKVSSSDFAVVDLLGRGACGEVSLVRNKHNNQLYAMKTINKQQLVTANLLQRTLDERAVLLKAMHPFLVSAHFTFQTETELFLVLDYVPGGELFRVLHEEGMFPEPRARLYAAEILLGLGYLHSIGCVYRDLKPENILVDRDGHLRITDFGGVKTGLNTHDANTTTFCGTVEYMAPEIVRQQPYTKSVDWWSFGALLWEMLVGMPPFYDENSNKLYRAILEAELVFPRVIGPQGKDLLSKLLERDGTKRLGSGPDDYKEIQAHPFFAALDWKKVQNREIEPVWKPQISTETDVSHFEGAENLIDEDDDEGERPRSNAPAAPKNIVGFTFVRGGE